MDRHMGGDPVEVRVRAHMGSSTGSGVEETPEPQVVDYDLGGRWGVSDAGKGGEGQAGCWCVILTTRPGPPSADTPEACVAQRGGAGATGTGWEPRAQAGGSFGALDPRLCGQWCLCILAYVQLPPGPTVSHAPHTSLRGPPTVLPAGTLQSSSPPWTGPPLRALVWPTLGPLCDPPAQCRDAPWRDHCSNGPPVLPAGTADAMTGGKTVLQSHTCPVFLAH